LPDVVLFLIFGLISCLLALIVFSVILLPAMGLMLLSARLPGPLGKAIGYPGIAAVIQFGFWLLWAAAMGRFSAHYASIPGPPLGWGYYILGFMLCLTPLAWLLAEGERNRDLRRRAPLADRLARRRAGPR
jgi:hypothetical protein